MIRAIIAFYRGLPGALIKRAKLGLMNAAIPIRTTIMLSISIIVFVNPIITPLNQN